MTPLIPKPAESPDASWTCGECAGLVSGPDEGRGDCPNCGNIRPRIRRRPFDALWVAVRTTGGRRTATLGAGVLAVTSASLMWPETMRRWMLPLFFGALAIAVVADWIRLPEGSLHLGAIILLPALLLPFLWQVVSVGVFTSYVVIGNLIEAAANWRRKRRSALQGPSPVMTAEHVSMRRRAAMQASDNSL